MTISRKNPLRGVRTLLAALVLGGGSVAATVAQAAPVIAPPVAAVQTDLVPVQYWGDHGGWGHRRHHDHHYGHRHGGYGRDHGWGHRRHDWGHRDHGWGHRHHGHHHHRGHGRYDY